MSADSAADLVSWRSFSGRRAAIGRVIERARREGWADLSWEAIDEIARRERETGRDVTRAEAEQIERRESYRWGRTR